MPTTRFAAQSRVPLPGSDRKPFTEAGNNRLPFANPKPVPAIVQPQHEHITISVIVRPKTPIDTARLAAGGNQPISRERFAEMHGADPDSVAMIKEFAREFGLQIEPETHPGRRTLHLTGSVASLEKAFGTKLEQRKAPKGNLRVRSGELTIPEELAGHITAVLGLDNRPQAKPHSRIARPRANGISYTPVGVAALYGFPTTGGAGQTIGIIELGGGYTTADIETYFRAIGQNPPVISAVSVDGGKSIPGDPSGADGEVMLDIEVAGTVAPGATIAVYFAPNTDQGFLDAITTAVNDGARKPGVISISWGGPESSWTQQALTAMDEACQAAAALGVTITVACGDSGATDGVADGANHVDFPASSPHVLACGGTKLVGTNTSITSEVVWNELSANEGATGGGVSTVFALPTWQQNAGVPALAGNTGGRGLPDVAGDADPSTGYKIRVDGQDTVIGGTSAVAPLWAGLIAIANAANGANAGFINPKLYAAKEASAFHDITSGTNGAFNAGPGWDACTGLGSPKGTAIVTAIKP